MTITAQARLAGILGWPVGHSLSPRLHGYWLNKHGIDGAYVPLPVQPEHFAQAVTALVHLGFRGANVTIPHKEAAFAVCETVSERARRIGAVNTLIFHDGRIEGDNTDGIGFLENLTQQAPHWRENKETAVVLGAGGAARAVAASLLDDGVSHVRLYNRSRDRAETLAQTLGGAIEARDWNRRSTDLAEASLVVNTTSLGMVGKDTLDIDLSALPPTSVVADIVYTPLQTDLLVAARQRGNPTVDGLGMLLHQARIGFAAWFEVMPEVDDDLRAWVLEGLRTSSS